MVDTTQTGTYIRTRLQSPLLLKDSIIRLMYTEAGTQLATMLVLQVCNPRTQFADDLKHLLLYHLEQEHLDQQNLEGYADAIRHTA